MSHLGQRLSALIDGELSTEERDRIHAHLAGCAACRAEANELRALKSSMRGLTDVPADDTLARKLTAIAEPGGPVPSRRRARKGKPRPRPGFRAFGGDASRPYARPGRHRGRYVVIGVASCVVVGLGVTAFSVGGGEPSPGPRITPPVQMYSIQHAITTGEVPFGGSSVVPAPAASAASAASQDPAQDPPSQQP
ncbi:MAG TPA: anti-sigma factor [Streptosporangiaceae bacterium]|jgi:anti-sigma factor RsiW|nr:anti-sigma factor [Streptosporangiaceae bacterium]